MAKINRDVLVAFLEATNNTNFEITARGNSLDGAVAPSITVKQLTQPNVSSSYAKEADISYSHGGRMIYGQQKSFDAALNAARGGDFVLACELLVDSYFYQVEMRPLRSIYVAGKWGIQPNPLAETLEPLIWHNENGEISGHGGAREGAGRPSMLSDSRLVSLDMERSMITVLDAEAKERGISRAELMRTLIAKGLSADNH